MGRRKPRPFSSHGHAATMGMASDGHMAMSPACWRAEERDRCWVLGCAPASVSMCTFPFMLPLTRMSMYGAGVRARVLHRVEEDRRDLAACDGEGRGGEWVQTQ